VWILKRLLKGFEVAPNMPENKIMVRWLHLEIKKGDGGDYGW
jgi:hypothetical protein